MNYSKVSVNGQIIIHTESPKVLQLKDRDKILFTLDENDDKVLANASIYAISDTQHTLYRMHSRRYKV
jgi:bifunctional DNA-binding transcriptional regulator/antitoxin component of YhaV-PrlF toxin-antitoxin module